LVRLDEVSTTLRDGPLDVHVLDRVSMTLPRGETTSLVGASGSGKSTLLGVIAGLRRATAGTIVIDGANCTALDDDGWARLRARRIGFVLQNGNLVPFLTAAENIELAAEFAGRRQPRLRAAELLEELGLGDRRHHLPRQLSGGEAQRVAIAVALVNEPELLLADEVTGELDSASADAVMNIIFDAARTRRLTVLYVTHSAEIAASAHHRLRLAGGQVGAA
jgi:putative ABC transport system ATP-binding protein